VPASSHGLASALDILEGWGLLLLQDRHFPSLVLLVAGEPVRGSWWVHPKGGDVFHAAGALETHPDITATKLISGKVTFVHRRLWPYLIAVGRARDRWQRQGLTAEARALLSRVDKEKRVQGSGSAAKMLEARLLVAGRERHSESGAHATELSSWETFARARKVRLPRVSAVSARAELERVVSGMNVEFGADGRLPWAAPARRAARPPGKAR
jgi:hypothetical protein